MMMNAIAPKMPARWLRTVLVKARSLSVASRTLPPLTGTAAEIIGVMSGALRTAVSARPRDLASTASLHAASRSGEGSA